MDKLIVTHIRPDLDACTSVWLIRRFYSGFEYADVTFLPAGDTYENKPADSDKNILHVDTGLGKFDHHQFRERLSASLRIYEYLIEKLRFKKIEREALERMVELVTMIDNFEEVHFDNPTSDIYDLMIYQVLEGVKINEADDYAVLEFMMTALDGLFDLLKRKVSAEKELEKGDTFLAGKHKCIFIKSKSKEASKLAEKSGYDLVLLQDPERGNVNIRVSPKAKFTLDKVYKEIAKIEGQDKWFYHSSGHMLLNGSNSHPQPPTKIKITQLKNILKSSLA